MGYIKPEELKGKSPSEVITLYLNRTNSTDFQPSQLDLIDAHPDEDEEGQFIMVVVQPKPITNWVNGPINVKVPVFDVTEYYQDKVIEIPYIGISQITQIGTYLRDRGAPPAKPKQITTGVVEDDPNGLTYTIVYHAVFANVFFVGDLPVHVTGVPKSLAAIKLVNDILLNPKLLN